MKMTRTTLSLEIDFYEEIKGTAKANGYARSAFMRHLLRLGLNHFINAEKSYSWKSATESSSSNQSLES